MGVPIWTGTPIHGVGFDRPCSKQKVDARTQCFTAAGAVLSAHLKVAQRVSLPAPFDGEFGVQVSGVPPMLEGVLTCLWGAR
jgi:hypothetical protein